MDRSNIPVALVAIILTSLICVVAVLAAIRQTNHEEGYRNGCASNLHLIGIALAQYNLRFGTLPPVNVVSGNGAPLYSWRVLIAPYMYPNVRFRGGEVVDLLEGFDYDSPWNSSHNTRWLESMPVQFACPADASAGELNYSTYCAVEGPGRDSTRRIVAVVECDGERVPWTAPQTGDSRLVRELADVLNGAVNRSQHRGGSNVFEVRDVRGKAENDATRSNRTGDASEVVFGSVKFLSEHTGIGSAYKYPENVVVVPFAAEKLRRAAHDGPDEGADERGTGDRSVK